MNSKDSLSILEVLENLNTLVEAESLDDLKVTETGVFISNTQQEEKTEREIFWVRAGANDMTLAAIRETFRTIHKYLISFYRKMKETGDQKRLMEGINTIMVLVGEAEQKLEKFDSIFKEKIPKLEEYKTLQNFYHNKVIKESYKVFEKQHPHEIETDEDWEKEFDELLQEESIIDRGGVHLLDDVEVVKNDHLYELFYLKNEAGHPFYTPDLARNLKLACDFGEFAHQYFHEDPLLQIKNWEDKSIHILAKKILKASKNSIEKFYREALKYREVELVSSLQKAITALMLAANPKTLIRKFSLKGSYLYFRDFQIFLRDVLANREYQRFLLYSPPSTTPFFADCLNLIHELAFNTITLGPNLHELEEALKKMTERKNGKNGAKKLSDFLTQSDHSLREVLSEHPSGPVFKALDIVREDEVQHFDPLMQGNLPTIEGILKMNGKEICLLRLPSPTTQEYIDHAIIIEEFKAFLYALQENQHSFHILIFNFQDRTSWKEHARCKALEEISRQAEFANVLTVVTLAKETDFYNQQEVYHDLNDAKEFINHFIDHLHDESTGYYFPPTIKNKLFPTFASELIYRCHDVFFNSKKSLSFRERLDFIEIVYNFIALKILEIVKPEYISFTSKDALDICGTSTIALMALLATSQGKKWNEADFVALNRTLFGPTLLHRERAVHKERFERTHDMIRLLEDKGDFLSKFKDLFSAQTLQSKPHFYKEPGEE